VKRVGRYEVLRTVARGGMAELLLAKAGGSHGFAKQVVLKRIHPHLADDPGFVEMFLDEARLAAQLDHPNVVSVFDLGEEDGETFFAMEYLRGADVRRLLEHADGSLPLEHAIAIGIGIAAGLHHAHTRVGLDGVPLAVIHRDVSPTNVIVTYEGAVKVVDFGIAKATSNQRHTRQSRIKGKIAYMSPEQCAGSSVDARSDVFSLGSVLYEMTTGARPFSADGEFAVMNAIVNGTVTPPSKHLRGYPRALQTIVMRAMARDPADRYASADELRQDLEAFASAQGWTLSPGPLGEYVRTHVPEALSQTPTSAPGSATEAATAPTIAHPVSSTSPRRAPMWWGAVLVLAAGAIGWFALARGEQLAPAEQARDAQVAAPAPTPPPPTPEPQPVADPKPEAEVEPEPSPESDVEPPQIPEVEAEVPTEPPKAKPTTRKRRRNKTPADETPAPPVDGNEWAPVRRNTP